MCCSSGDFSEENHDSASTWLHNCVRRDVDGDASPTGGVYLFTSNLYPSNFVTLHTSLQAVAVRIHILSLVTVCCVYLSPNDVVPQVDLNQLVSQLPAPFLLLGDFNRHSPLWGHDDTNSCGRQVEQLISDHCLCLHNNHEKTYFHAPTRTLHSLDLAICTPSLLPLLNFEVDQDLHNSDHFLLLVSHVNGAGVRNHPPTYRFHRADWDKFTRLAIITGIMVQDGTVNYAVLNVTEVIRNAAGAAIPKTLNFHRKLCKPWWNSTCQQAKKERRRKWGIFRRYPTTDNLIAFKRAKALPRKIRRQIRENLRSNMCLQSHRQLPINSCGERSKQRMAFIGTLLFRYWKHRLLFTRRLLLIWPT
ncbi:putative RNA-directed DNA polymerase from transposon X-element [Trichonephila clavipes]|uniref:Putative RNA-directed DNA polymerase from transposon X-element n=1 Tax=Trichonephila clavipes TaxID=2585209 RepID=A0A8X6SE54_TRICX|nr:putative RNA-directed DNA polymerase from transposon X-element [Trichonephila clavipes]